MGACSSHHTKKNGHGIKTVDENIYTTNLKFKILTVGDNGVGKTTFLNKWGGDQIGNGVDYRNKKMNIDNKEINVTLWDTGGMERFKNITLTYYRGAHAVLLFFDLTNKDSFENLVMWHSDSERYTQGKSLLVVVGNRLDLSNERTVQENEIIEFCNLKSIDHFETSAKTGDNVDNIINLVCHSILEKRGEDDED